MSRRQQTGDNLGNNVLMDSVPGRGYVGPWVAVGMRVRLKRSYNGQPAGTEGTVVRNGIPLGRVRVLPDGATLPCWVPLRFLQLLRP